MIQIISSLYNSNVTNIYIKKKKKLYLEKANGLMRTIFRCYFLLRKMYSGVTKTFGKKKSKLILNERIGISGPRNEPFCNTKDVNASV